MDFTKYDTNSTEITVIGGCPDNIISEQRQAGESILVGIYPPDRYYIFSSLPRAKYTFSLIVSKYTITADGVDQCEITNIPSNTIIVIDNTSFIVNGGTFILTSTEVSEIILDFNNRFYITSRITINAI